MRWRVAGRMALAWIITLPMAAVVGAVAWYVADLVGGGLAGALLVFVVLLVASVAMYLRSRLQPVDAATVSSEWTTGASTDAATVDA